jgi:putative transposase
VTQRGNARRFILDSNADRRIYLDLLKKSLALHDVTMTGYCLMSNHVHLVLAPRRAESLGLALKHAHGRYASYWNAAHHSSGHVWQGRYYSCPLDEPHLWEALRYTELNPVRSGLVAKSTSWVWSSAAALCAAGSVPEWLALEPWQSHWTTESWESFLCATEDASALASIRLSTHTGRPLGIAEFVHALERSTQRPLAPQRRGRRLRAVADPRQTVLPLKV